MAFFCPNNGVHLQSEAHPIEEKIMLEQFVGQEVVVDMRSPFVCLGDAPLGD